MVLKLLGICRLNLNLLKNGICEFKLTKDNEVKIYK